MRENPSKGYIDWALSRFGPEWVEAHLSVSCECEGAQSETGCPNCGGEIKRPVEIRRTIGTPAPKKKTALAWARKRKKVILTDFQHSARPSLN